MNTSSLSVSSLNRSRACSETTTADDEVVHDLFGSIVGQYINEYACSYYRQSATLYVTTKKLLLYSTGAILGFERRLVLDWTEIELLELYRTTSIRVLTIDAEEFIFRSFLDRETTLKVLTAAKAEEDKRFDQLLGGSVRRELHHEEVASTLTAEPLRPRTQSPPQMDSPSSSTAPSSPPPFTPVRTPLQSMDQSIASTAAAENLEQAWKQAKSNSDPSYQETPIPLMELSNCRSLQDFYQLFLADDAPYSMTKFQQEHIGDSEIEITKWKEQQDGDSSTDKEEQQVDVSILTDDDDNMAITSMVRTITFVHPISATLGPSSANAKREQCLKQYGCHGIILESATFVKGVPASDCMYVDDKWIIEPAPSSSNGGVTLTVQHQTRFTSRTMLKSIITSNTKAEVKSWYDKYTKMLQAALSDEPSTSKEKDVPVDVSAIEAPIDKDAAAAAPQQRHVLDDEKSPRGNGVLLLLIACIAAVAIIIQGWMMQRRIIELESRLDVMQRELHVSMEAIQKLVAQDHQQERQCESDYCK